MHLTTLRSFWHTVASWLIAALVMAVPMGFTSASAVSAADAKLQLNKGDHICIVGSGLAERMQHAGWLETLIHARFPQHDLVFRNLGYPGDEIDGWRNFNSRLRSMDFGSYDQWLAGSAPFPSQASYHPAMRIRSAKTALS